MTKKAEFLDLRFSGYHSRAHFANSLNCSGSLEKADANDQSARNTSILFNRFFPFKDVSTTGCYNYCPNDLITTVSIRKPTIVPPAAGLIRLSSTSITLNFAI